MKPRSPVPPLTRPPLTRHPPTRPRSGPPSQAFVELTDVLEPRRGADLPERLRVAGGARRVHAQAPARCVRTRSPPGRAAAAVPARRSRPQPAPRASRGSARRAVRGHGERPCAHARSSPASGRAGGRAPAHHARCLRARAARQLQPRARLAGGDGESLSRPSRGGGGDGGAGGAAAVRSDQRPRVPLSGVGGRGGDAQALRAVPVAPARTIQGRRRGARERRRPTGAGAPDHREARSARVLPAPPRHAGAGPGGGARGARTGQRPRPAAAGAGPRLERLVDRLLPDRPLARRPDRQRPADRPVPERGADLAARHRPRLPARHQGEADPAGPRALRPRPLGAGGGFPDLPRPRGDPRARQGAGAAAGGDRTRGPGQRGVGRARSGQGHRLGVRHRAPKVPPRTTAGAGRRAAGRGSRAWPPRPTDCRAT